MHIYHLRTDVSTHHTYYNCLMKHFSINGNFATSYLCAINWWRMSKGILFISDICNPQGTHIQKSVAGTDTTFNLIHYFNWHRRHHTTISAWRTCKKSIRALYDESKVKLRAPLGQWTLEDNKCITSWQWFLSHDIHTIHYRDNRTWWKYTWTLKYARARRCILFQTDTNSFSKCPSCSQVFRKQSDNQMPKIYTDRSNRTIFSSGNIWTSSAIIGKKFTLDEKLSISFKQKNHRHKCLVTHITFGDKLDVLYSDYTYNQDIAISDESYWS